MIAHGIDLDNAAIREFCRKWNITELSVFGSILRDDFRPDSDVDFLVDYEEDAYWEIEELDEMERQLGTIVGRDVDILNRRTVQKSRNYIKRKHILRTAESVHAQR